MKTMNDNLTNRELSWLSYSSRILQEAKDPRVPLYERIRFLGIFSSNLDEYFRVRVVAIKGLLKLKKKARKKLGIDPADLLKQIKKKVYRQQVECGAIFRKQILNELNNHNIYLLSETELDDEQREFARGYFKEHVEPLIAPVFIGKNKEAPFLQNKALYLAVKLLPRTRPGPREEPHGDEEEYKYAIVEIPSQRLQRFVTLPKSDGKISVMFLDDVARLCLPDVFPNHDVISSYAIKLTRDAELYIEDEFSGDLLEKIKLGLGKRKAGIPSRFLYDAEMLKKFLKLLRDTFFLTKEDLIPGARYHNFNDLMDFPNPKLPEFTYDPLHSLSHPELDKYPTVSEAVQNKDHLIHFPYQSFDYVTRFLQEAARDPDVTSIKITLYRVANNSQVVKSLIEGAMQGKSVTAFVEVKARFDEESNLYWAEELEKAGVKALYSFPGLKVHAKLCLISRVKDGQSKECAYLATGNFNEQTARVYSDLGLFTADERLTTEVARVFDFLAGNTKDPQCEHLLVSPFGMREAFTNLIDTEMKHARKGRQAYMMLKMNSLEDPGVIEKLYEASDEGVKISIIVRGICCLIPGVKKLSENIKVVSIVDRFLEHSRVYIFHNNGEERYYVASADWMFRNLSRRVEVAFPIYSEEIKTDLRKIIDFQLQDNTKARIINARQNNKYRHSRSSIPVRAQVATYDFLKERAMESQTAG